MAELTLHNGDCLEVMKQIPDKSVDLIICDLPYGSITCSWDVKIDLEAFWKQVKRIRRSDHTPTLHFCTTKFGYDLIKSNPDEFRYDLVWDKGRGVSFLSANKMPMRSHEMIYVFSKAGAFYARKDIPGTPYSTSGNSPGRIYQKHNTGKSDPKTISTRCVLSVIPDLPSAKRGGHPTEKPTELYKFLIERYCPVGGTVLDPTAGSCNSVFEAFRLGRNAIGIEKDDGFFKKAEDRLNAL